MSPTPAVYPPACIAQPDVDDASIALASAMDCWRDDAAAIEVALNALADLRVLLAYLPLSAAAAAIADDRIGEVELALRRFESPPGPIR